MTYPLSPDAIAACKQVFEGHRSIVLRIAEEVSAHSGVPVAAILSSGRVEAVARARHIVMYEARRAGLSYPQIARAMNRHHTSVMHGVRAEKKRRAM